MEVRPPGPVLVPGPWKPSLLTLRTQIADYEREGTSTPGKLKRAARLRTCRMALREVAPDHAAEAARLKSELNRIEAAEKNDNWRLIAELVREMLAALDGLIGTGG
ncbi:MAG: hypothetical protein ACRD01_03815 [Terriglobales bacterium]